jgi:hypothetical protein
MRWFIEVSRVGEAAPPEKYCVEAKQWQGALQEARRLRGDSGPLSRFAIELLDTGYRAVDATLNVRYLVHKAPRDAPLSLGAQLEGRPSGEYHYRRASWRPSVSGMTDSLSSELRRNEPSKPERSKPELSKPENSRPAISRPEPPRPSTGRSQELHSASDSAEGAINAELSPIAMSLIVPIGNPVPQASLPLPPSAMELPLATPLAARAASFAEANSDTVLASEFQLIRKREEQPTAATPITYREYAYAVAPGTSRASLEALIWARYREVAAQIQASPKGKFVQLAIFDHAFETRPVRAPLATLAWKDWRGEPVVSYPGLTDLEPAQSGTEVLSPQPSEEAFPPQSGEEALPLQRAAEMLSPQPDEETSPTSPGEDAFALQRSAQAFAPQPSAEAFPPHPSVQAFPLPPSAGTLAPLPSEGTFAPPPSAGTLAPLPSEGTLPPPSDEVFPELVERSPHPLSGWRAAQSTIDTVAADEVAALTDRLGEPQLGQAQLELLIEDEALLEDEQPARERAVAPPAPSSQPRLDGPRLERRHRSDEDLIAELFETMHHLRFLPDLISGADFVLKVLADAVPCELAIVHIFDINTRQFVVVRAIGPDSEKLLLHRTPDQDVLLDSALRRRRALRVDDAATDPNYGSGRFHVTSVRAESALCGGVQQHGRYLGAIELINPPGGGPFYETELNALDYICEQFAEFVASRPIVIDADVVLGGARR